MIESNTFTVAQALHKPSQLIYKYFETIDIVGYMFHVKHLSQFDRKTSMQICKQLQLSRTLLIELEDSNSIDIRGDMFHVKHILIRQKYIWQMY